MLLLDQNISDKIISALQANFPGTVHVKQIGLDRGDDRNLWRYALEHNLTILTNDDDFENLAKYHGFPPKVIHLTAGNLSRKQMLAIVSDNAERLRQFIESNSDGYLALS